MLEWFGKTKWRDSSAYLTFLKEFLRPCPTEHFKGKDYWAVVLKQDPVRAIHSLVKDGALEAAVLSLPEKLAEKFKVPELKGLLKARGLKTSGTKDNLVDRLVDNDSASMEDATRECPLHYRCTVEARDLVDKYFAKQKQERDAVDQVILSHFQAHDYSSAVETFKKYMDTHKPIFSESPFSLGPMSSQEYVSRLRIIFERTPKILAAMSAEKLQTVRLTAAMTLLGARGSRPPDAFQTGIHLDGQTACRMLYFLTNHLHNIDQIKAAGIKRVKVLSCGPSNSCAKCEQLNKRVYDLADVPELPYQECTHPIGCRCTIVPA